MKNLLYIAAIAATAVGFTSCSSNEDLNDAVKDSGVPFKVTASAPTTRATDLTSSNFTNFQLYAFEGTNEWISGARFTKNPSWAPFNVNETYNWPHAGVTSKFYAVSENGTEMSSAFAVNDIANTQSFTYTVPTTVANQKDLLIASAEGMSTDAKVSLEFKHALAAANLKFTITPTYTAYTGTTYSTYRLHAKIKSITFNNVYTSGTYSFANSAWNNLATKGSYTIGFNTPIEIDTKASAITPTTITVDLSNIGSIMFIPQTIDKDTYWDIAPGKQLPAVLTAAAAGDKAYISLEAQTILYDANSNTGSDLISGLEYEMANNSNPLGITKVTGKTDDENGYFDNANKKIATLEGEIKNISPTCVINYDNIYNNGYFGDALSISWITYTKITNEPTQDFAADPAYGTLYKAFALATYKTDASVLTVTNSDITLSNTKNHNLNIDISACVNKATGDGAFGTLGIAGGN